jgi:hypothetical protein
LLEFLLRNQSALTFTAVNVAPAKAKRAVKAKG